MLIRIYCKAIGIVSLVSTYVYSVLSYASHIIEVLFYHIFQTFAHIDTDRTFFNTPVTAPVIGTDLFGRINKTRREHIITVFCCKFDGTYTSSAALDGTISNINRNIRGRDCDLLRIEVSLVTPDDTVDEFVVTAVIAAIHTAAEMIREVVNHGTVKQL